VASTTISRGTEPEHGDTMFARYTDMHLRDYSQNRYCHENHKVYTCIEAYFLENEEVQDRHAKVPLLLSKC
jgi:hypothetical protein